MHDPNEVIVQLADGRSLRSGVYDPADPAALTSGEYVRLCDTDGKETDYWDQAEWSDDPALVMGAIINRAAGIVPLWTDEDAARLVRLEAAFDEAGGRGVELADEIDELRRVRDGAAV